MVAQTKVDVRSAAAKTAAADKQGPQDEVVVDNKELLEDQAAAAAVVDAGQSDAVAVQVTAEAGILPTDAPLQSIGEIAQAPAPTTTDTTTPATTPAPAAEAEAATTLSPWAIGGIALVGIGAVAAAANSGDDDNPAPPPPPPPDPVNSLPTSTDGQVVLAGPDTALSDANFPFVDADAADTLASVTIASITPTFDPGIIGDEFRFDEASGKGYELVKVDGDWAAAKLAAEAKGGYLAVLDSEAEMTLINTLYNDLGGASGIDGTWVGASQAADAALPGDGWTWVNGAPLAGDSSLWNLTADPVQTPWDNDGDEADHSAQYGAIFNGDTPDTDFKLLYDAPTLGETTLPNYLVEYDLAATPLTLDGVAVTAGQTIAHADLAKLSWDSMFNEGGSITYNVTDSQGGTSAAANTLTFTNPVTFDGGASQSISALIEDQHLTGLA